MRTEDTVKCTYPGPVNTRQPLLLRKLVFWDVNKLVSYGTTEENGPGMVDGKSGKLGVQITKSQRSRALMESSG